jgi:hypothetical protein
MFEHRPLRRSFNAIKRSVLRAVMINWNPSFASDSAMASPNPELAPVMNAYPFILQK